MESNGSVDTKLTMPLLSPSFHELFRVLQHFRGSYPKYSFFLTYGTKNVIQFGDGHQKRERERSFGISRRPLSSLLTTDTLYSATQNIKMEKSHMVCFCKWEKRGWEYVGDSLICGGPMLCSTPPPPPRQEKVIARDPRQLCFIYFIHFVLLYAYFIYLFCCKF